MKESVFYRKTRAQQEVALKKFHNLAVKTVDIIPIDLENTNEADTMPPLSLALEDFGIIRVHFSILARMYHRASLILARKEEISIPILEEGTICHVMWQTRQLMLHRMQFARNVPCDVEHIMCAAALVSILKRMTFVLIL